MGKGCTSLISIVDSVYVDNGDFAFNPPKISFPSTESRPAPPSHPSQILLTVCLFNRNI